MSDINTDSTATEAAANIAAIREIADFLETHPLIASRLTWITYNLNVFARTDEEWDAMRKELGSYEKVAGTYYLAARVTIGDRTQLDVNRDRADVCTKVKVGEREVQVEVYPADVTPAIETQIEDVYEWECPPSWSTKD